MRKRPMPKRLRTQMSDPASYTDVTLCDVAASSERSMAGGSGTRSERFEGVGGADGRANGRARVGAAGVPPRREGGPCIGGPRFHTRGAGVAGHAQTVMIWS